MAGRSERLPREATSCVARERLQTLQVRCLLLGVGQQKRTKQSISSAGIDGMVVFINHRHSY
jgi:hypothetical protein